jgi:hypothetical protein
MDPLDLLLVTRDHVAAAQHAAPQHAAHEDGEGLSSSAAHGMEVLRWIRQERGNRRDYATRARWTRHRVRNPLTHTVVEYARGQHALSAAGGTAGRVATYHVWRHVADEHSMGRPDLDVLHASPRPSAAVDPDRLAAAYTLHRGDGKTEVVPPILVATRKEADDIAAWAEEAERNEFFGQQGHDGGGGRKKSLVEILAMNTEPF